MNQVLHFTGGDARTKWAKDYLEKQGYQIAEGLANDAETLVLPTPAFDGEHVRGGASVGELLSHLRPGMSVIGGQLTIYRHELEQCGAAVFDLLEDAFLAAQNAELTAEGALALLMQELPVCIKDAPILVIGWGRIGKLLTRKLHALGADVTASARKEQDLAMIEALGMHACITGDYANSEQFRAIINTVPAITISENSLSCTRDDIVLLELASAPGGFPKNCNRRVIRAGGLPGKYAPETAGICIGQAIMRLAERSTACPPAHWDSPSADLSAPTAK